MWKPIRKARKPECALNGVEYLCLKMFLNPGRSQRFYRRSLEMYSSQSVSHPHQIVGHGMYFRHWRGGPYRDVLWVDHAPKTVIDHMPSFGPVQRKPRVSQMYLTQKGIERALGAATKIGMKLNATMEQRGRNAT